MGLPFNRTPDGKIDQRRFGGHTRNYGEAAVRARLLRGRPHRPHDPADALPAVRQARRHLLRRVPRARLLVDGRRSARGVVALRARRPASCTSSTPRPCMFATGGFGRMFKITSNAHALTGDGLGARLPPRASRSRTWSSSSSTRRASTGSASSSPRPRAARAASCATARASGSWSATPDAHGPRAARHGQPRDLPGDPRGRGAGERQGLRLPRPDPPRAQRSSRRSCPTSPSSRAIYLGVEPDHGADARPADGPLRHGRHPDRHRRPGRHATRTARSCRACTRRASARASACTAPTAWAPTRSSTCRVRPPRGPRMAARTPAGRRAELGRRRGAGARRRSRRSGTGDRGRERRATSARPAEHDDGQRRRLRTEETLERRGQASPASRRATRRRRRRQGHAVQHGPAGGARARLPARLRGGAGRRRAHPHREPRARTPARTSRSATTRTGSSTRWPTATRTGAVRFDYKPVTLSTYEPEAARVLRDRGDARSRICMQVDRCEDQALRPRARRDAALGGVHASRPSRWTACSTCSTGQVASRTAR